MSKRSNTVRTECPPAAPPAKENLSNSLPKLRANPRTNIPASARNSLPIQSSDVQTALQGSEDNSVLLAPSSTLHFTEILQYCKVIIDFENPQTIGLRTKKADYLTKIYNTVINVQAFRNLPSEVRLEIFEMIKINLLRQIPPIPLTIIYADFRVPINTNSWMHLSIIHRILYQYVSNSESSFLHDILTKDFIQQYVSLFESPDPKETQAVESFILLVFDTVSGYRQLIFQTVLKQILKYLDNFTLYPCIAPCLRFMLHFLKIQQTPLKLPFFDLYKKIIFPLITSQMSYEFYEPFSLVTEYYVAQDHTLSIWILQEIVKHWPLTDTNKECSFINIFTFIAPYLKSDIVLECGKIIFRILNKALNSSNFKVNASALAVITNRNFMVSFISQGEILYPMIMQGIDKCSYHWNPNIQKTAVDAARVVVSIKPDFGANFQRHQLNNPENSSYMKEGWMAILNQAHINDNSINIEKIKDVVLRLS